MIKQSINSIIYTAIFAVLISFIIGCGGDDDPQTLSTGYLPIEVGNSWIFIDPEYPEYRDFISITGTTKLSNGKTVFIATTEKNDKGYLSRAANDLLLFHETLSDLQGELIYSPPIKVGTTWQGKQGEAEVVAQETVNTPAGIFQDCFRINVRVVDSYGYYSVWLAKDIGPVKLSAIDSRDGEIESTVVLDRFGKNLGLQVSTETENEKETLTLPEAFLVSVTPAPGGELARNGSVKVTFTDNPGDVTGSAGTVAGSGKTRIISGPFSLGVLSLTIEWTNGDGSHTFNYIVVAE